METKRIDLEFEVKEASEEGKIVGMASTYNNVDYGGDVVRPGAFTKTLQENPTVQVFVNHDHQVGEWPIGKGTMTEMGRGIRMEADLDMGDQRAVDLLRKMKMGLMRGLSIGYKTIKENPIANGIRELLEVQLVEVSITPFPMNPKALVTAVKQDPALTEPPASTPPAEPPAPVPPAATKGIEPEIDHSGLQKLTSFLR